jgi:hypothetical protein
MKYEFCSLRPVCDKELNVSEKKERKLCEQKMHLNGMVTNNDWRFSFHFPVKYFLFIYCGLVVRVPGYTTEMYCVSCEVRTEFIYVM